jgi:hypothetical protein
MVRYLSRNRPNGNPGGFPGRSQMGRAARPADRPLPLRPAAPAVPHNSWGSAAAAASAALDPEGFDADAAFAELAAMVRGVVR